MSKYALTWALELLYLELYVLMIQDYLTEKKIPIHPIRSRFMPISASFNSPLFLLILSHLPLLHLTPADGRCSKMADNISARKEVSRV